METGRRKQRLDDTMHCQKGIRSPFIYVISEFARGQVFNVMALSQKSRLPETRPPVMELLFVFHSK
jgi:hypothetical protein